MPEIYHNAVHQLFEHISSVDTSMDNIIVYRQTLEEHNNHLQKVLEIVKMSNMKLNKEKMCVWSERIDIFR